MSKTPKRPRIVLPTEAEDEAIQAAALADPDAQPLTDAQLQSMVPLKSLRGRPKSERPKQSVTIRYSPEVIEYFRATGEGWQSRMDEVLRKYVARQLGRQSGA